jgi:hypothetical protein
MINPNSNYNYNNNYKYKIGKYLTIAGFMILFEFKTVCTLLSILMISTGLKMAFAGINEEDKKYLLVLIAKKHDEDIKKEIIPIKKEVKPKNLITNKFKCFSNYKEDIIIPLAFINKPNDNVTYFYNIVIIIKKIDFILKFDKTSNKELLKNIYNHYYNIINFISYSYNNNDDNINNILNCLEDDVNANFKLIRECIYNIAISYELNNNIINNNDILDCLDNIINIILNKQMEAINVREAGKKY